MNLDLEIGKLTEAVVGLKKGQDDHAAALKALDDKVDRHLSNYSDLKLSVGRIAGGLALITSILFAGVKEAIARILR